MKNIQNKLLLSTALLFLSIIINAQVSVPPPPPDQPNSDGPGALTQPIDMYVIYLFITAVSMITFYAYKKSKNKLA